MPSVSIIVPCYNEQATIGFLLKAINDQTYPSSDMEVIIADGLSTDDTRREISKFQRQFPGLPIKVIDNLDRSIPSALNRAIEEAQGEYILRLDAHSVPNRDYVARCVGAIEAGKGENVGGVWDIRPGGDSWIARSIAIAASHPLGVGDARYRVGGRAQSVDTVPFGAFRRSLIDRIGPFDEGLLTNEDYEFNVRVRQSGGKVWMDPKIRSIYFARPNLGDLARQYWRYGFWKARVLKRYPHTIRWRQLLPPMFVSSLLVLLAASIFLPVLLWGLAAEIVIYVMVLLASGIRIAWRKKELLLAVGVPSAITMMHLAWGTALLWSLASGGSQ
jgi:succinoglycan biosynthesis protein ExoA